MVKVEIHMEANIPNPKIGELYGDYGLCGRPGHLSFPIKTITKTHIHLKDDGQGIMKDRKTKVSLVEYFYKKIMSGIPKQKNTLRFDGKEVMIE